MKLNGTPRHYMPLSQNQSDDEDNGGTKGLKCSDKCCKNPGYSKNLDKRLNLPKAPVQIKKYEPMSFWRTFVFVFSLCICFVFIAAFLFLLPCRPETLGVGNIGDLLEKWKVMLPNISLSSDVALAITSHLSSPLLIFGYSLWENFTCITKGVVALRKSDGVEIWKLPLHSEPTSVICNKMDVNADGIYDCLVTGESGLLTAVDTRRGVSLWYIHSHRDVKLGDAISNPTILPDCDDDGIPDLAVSGVISGEENAVFLMLVSGSTGEIIGSPVSLLHCTSRIIGHSVFEIGNKTAFIFYCPNGNAGQLFLSYVKDIRDVALNRTDSMKLTVLYRSSSSLSNSEFHMVSALYGKKIVLISSSKAVLLVQTVNGKFKIKWQKYLSGDLLWRYVTHGSFLKSESSEAVFLGLNNSMSQLIGVDTENGNVVWIGTFNNSIVTSVLSVPKFFRDVDGIILKLLKPARNQIDKLKPTFPVKSEQKIVNSTDEASDNYSPDISNKLIEESFILVHVNDLPRAKIISLEEIWENCRGTSCHPDVYNNKAAAVTEVLNTGEVDVSMVTVTAAPRNSSVLWEIRTSVKLLKIEKFSKFSKCMYTLES